MLSTPHNGFVSHNQEPIIDPSNFFTMTSVVALMWMLGAFVLIAWLLLPFAMFGIKPLLRQLLNETQETNRLLATQGLIRRPPPQPQPQPQPQRQRPSFADAKIQEDYVQ